MERRTNKDRTEYYTSYNYKKKINKFFHVYVYRNNNIQYVRKVTVERSQVDQKSMFTNIVSTRAIVKYENKILLSRTCFRYINAFHSIVFIVLYRTLRIRKVLISYIDNVLMLNNCFTIYYMNDTK